MQNSILTNMNSIFIKNDLNFANNKLSISLERLSSGLKINQAKDDASGSVLLSRIKTQLSGTKIANENTMHGINMLNIADDALRNMSDKINRIRTLALETMNSTYTDEQRFAIQTEINELTAEIKREKETTTYNNKLLFQAYVEELHEVTPAGQPYLCELTHIESTGTQYIDTGYAVNLNDNFEYRMKGDFTGNSGRWNGANGAMQLYFKDNEVAIRGTDAAKGKLTGDDEIVVEYRNKTEYLTVNNKGVYSKTWALSAKDYKIGIFKMGVSGNAFGIYNVMKGKLESYQLYKDDVLVRDYIPVLDNNRVACLYDKVSGQLFYSEGADDFVAGDEIEGPKEYQKVLVPNLTDLHVGKEAGDSNMVNIDLTFELGSLSMNVSTAENAKETIEKCDKLNEKILNKLSSVGSSLNRLESIIELQNNDIINLNSKKSIIADTDMAKESAEFARTQIIKQVTSSLFSQSHKMNKNLALALIRRI